MGKKPMQFALVGDSLGMAMMFVTNGRRLPIAFAIAQFGNHL